MCVASFFRKKLDCCLSFSKKQLDLNSLLTECCLQNRLSVGLVLISKYSTNVYMALWCTPFLVQNRTFGQNIANNFADWDGQLLPLLSNVLWECTLGTYFGSQCTLGNKGNLLPYTKLGPSGRGSPDTNLVGQTVLATKNQDFLMYLEVIETDQLFFSQTCFVG